MADLLAASIVNQASAHGRQKALTVETCKEAHAIGTSELGTDADTTPTSSCSTAWNTSEGFSSASSSSSLASDDCEDKDTSDEEEDVCVVEQLLEEMNSASDRVNDLQKKHASHEQERVAFEQLWAVSSARAVRTIGEERLARARPVHVQQCFCRMALEAAQLASSRYVSAVHAGAEPPDELARLTQQHSACLAWCSEAQLRLAKLQEACALDWEYTAPYFEAEEDHMRYLSELGEAIKDCATEMKAAKVRYQSALMGLEALSEKIHSRRRSAKA